MENIKLLIAYDGTHYCGWQHSLENVLKRTIETIYQHPIYLQAASRTDAGVHAHGQVVNYLTHKKKDLSRLFCSLNQLLPKDIVIRGIAPAAADFHPTLNALGKEYRYYICHGKIQFPQYRLYSWHVHYPLDFLAIQAGAKLLCGKKDFSSFCNQGSDACYVDFIREIFSIDLHSIDEDRFYFSIKGNSFLYKMVRNLVGTLIDIGKGKLHYTDLEKILFAKNRIYAGMSAPAHGLYLHEVFY